MRIAPTTTAGLRLRIGVDHRHAEAVGDGGDECPLHDHGEEHDDEHDPVDLRRLVGAADDGE